MHVFVEVYIDLVIRLRNLENRAKAAAAFDRRPKEQYDWRLDATASKDFAKSKKSLLPIN